MKTPQLTNYLTEVLPAEEDQHSRELSYPVLFNTLELEEVEGGKNIKGINQREMASKFHKSDLTVAFPFHKSISRTFF